MSLRLLFLCCLTWLLCACTTGGGVYHTVQKGQTLYTISRTYEVDESYLARINGISNPSLLRAGKQLYIPGVQNLKPVPVTVGSEPPPRTVVRSRAVNAVEKKASLPAPKTANRDNVPAPTTDAVKKDPPPADRNRFIWPARGRVVARFGEKQAWGGKGLEIAVAEGTPVGSAAAGKVIYSGDGITGYGNLVIVRHDDSFFTVYGYNRKLLVNTGDFVSKGQEIALSGQPPKGGTPRLYFEIRYGRKPVDPIFYLP